MCVRVCVREREGELLRGEGSCACCLRGCSSERDWLREAVLGWREETRRRRSRRGRGVSRWARSEPLCNLHLCGVTSRSKVFWERLGQIAIISFLSSASIWCLSTPPTHTRNTTNVHTQKYAGKHTHTHMRASAHTHTHVHAHPNVIHSHVLTHKHVNTNNHNAKEGTNNTHTNIFWLMVARQYAPSKVLNWTWYNMKHGVII